MNQKVLAGIEAAVDEEIEASLEFARSSPDPDPGLPAAIVYATPLPPPR